MLEKQADFERGRRICDQSLSSHLLIEKFGLYLIIKKFTLPLITEK